MSPHRKETVAVEAHGIGPHARAFQGIPPTHRQIELFVVVIPRFRDRLIAKHVICDDAADLFQRPVIARKPEPMVGGDLQ